MKTHLNRLATGFIYGGTFCGGIFLLVWGGHHYPKITFSAIVLGVAYIIGLFSEIV
jgi:hypothetical protein